jgi:hypothetical protein
MSDVEMLAKLPFVDWVGRYEPWHKYREDETSEAPFPTSIVTLEADRPEFRNQLREMGVDTVQYFDIPGFQRGYGRITADRKLIAKLAELWWVRQIMQHRGTAKDL